MEETRRARLGIHPQIPALDLAVQKNAVKPVKQILFDRFQGKVRGEEFAGLLRGGVRPHRPLYGSALCGLAVLHQPFNCLRNARQVSLVRAICMGDCLLIVSGSLIDFDLFGLGGLSELLAELSFGIGRNLFPGGVHVGDLAGHPIVVEDSYQVAQFGQVLWLDVV